MLRINKFLSQSGIASRRKADELISSGQVKINGNVAKLGDVVDPDKDVVLVERKRVYLESKKVLYALYKPRGIISTAVDEQGRRSVVDLVPPDPKVFPVGRLDKESEGLILLTNDGDLANQLTHPKFEVQKVYHAWIDRPAKWSIAHILKRLGRSYNFDGVEAKLDKAEIIDEAPRQLKIEVVIHEGSKHHIRRFLNEAGFATLRLKRVQHGPIQIESLESGQWRQLDIHKIKDNLNI